MFNYGSLPQKHYSIWFCGENKLSPIASNQRHFSISVLRTSENVLNEKKVSNFKGLHVGSLLGCCLFFLSHWKKFTSTSINFAFSCVRLYPIRCQFPVKTSTVSLCPQAEDKVQMGFKKPITELILFSQPKAFEIWLFSPRSIKFNLYSERHHRRTGTAKYPLLGSIGDKIVRVCFPQSNYVVKFFGLRQMTIILIHWWKGGKRDTDAFHFSCYCSNNRDSRL